MYTIGAIADLVSGKDASSSSAAEASTNSKKKVNPARPAPRYVEFESKATLPPVKASRRERRLGRRLHGELLPRAQEKLSEQGESELICNEDSTDESGRDEQAPIEELDRGSSKDNSQNSSRPARNKKKENEFKRKVSSDNMGNEADASKPMQPLKRRKQVDATHSNVDTENETSPLVPDDNQNEQKNRREKKVRHPDTPDKDERTIFVGNLPGTATQKAVRHVFSKYGTIESIRFRSIVPAKESLSKKVAFISKALHSNKQTVNAYVVFKAKEAVNKAITLNGSVLFGNHIRVDCVGAPKSQVSEKQTVFVGNLAHEVQDEELWKLFAECGDVVAVRLVRDKVTGMGKGFGFVTFKQMDGAALALEMTGREVSGRPIRVSPFSKQAVPKKAVQQRSPFQRKAKKAQESLEGVDFKGSQAEHLTKKKRKLKKQIREKVQQKLQKKIFQLGGGSPKKAKKKDAKQPNKVGE
uniref:Nucleolar protein 12 n=1 Tax=Rhipicephalus zambeziensis TaxID=60191 RepID=A0A224YV41_9ACAR